MASSLLKSRVMGLRTRLLLARLLALPLTPSGFKPLGSEPPASCRIDKYDCPSHYICVPTKGSDPELGVCKCNGFYGFYGDDCTKLSAASHLSLALWFLNALGLIYCMWRNLGLFWRLHETGRMRFNAILKSLIFNTIFPLPCMGMCAGFICTVLAVLEDSTCPGKALYTRLREFACDLTSSWPQARV